MPLYSDYQSLNLGQMESAVLRKLWINAQEDSNGFPVVGAFATKYSKYRVDLKINQAYAEMVYTARALRSWFIVPLKANYTQYPVPDGVYDIEQVFFFQSATSYTELTVEELRYIEDQLSPGWMAYPSIPEYAYVGDKTGMRIKLGVAPAAKTDATAIAIASSGSSVTRPFGGAGAVYGAAGPSATGFNYVDSAAQDFTALGVDVGLRLNNVSTGVTGAITSVLTTDNPNDTLVTATVTWTPGDVMRILSGELGSTIAIGADEATYILTPTSGGVPQPLITMAANNLLVRAWSYPALLNSQYQYPELSGYFHEGIVYGAAAYLAEEEPPDSPEFAQGKVYEAKFAAAKGELKGFVAAQYKSSPRLISRDKR